LMSLRSLTNFSNPGKRTPESKTRRCAGLLQ
jgi:hypothetical protein